MDIHEYKPSRTLFRVKPCSTKPFLAVQVNKYLLILSVCADHQLLFDRTFYWFVACIIIIRRINKSIGAEYIISYYDCIIYMQGKEFNYIRLL